jgi:hypothetical protein
MDDVIVNEGAFLTSLNRIMVAMKKLNCPHVLLCHEKTYHAGLFNMSTWHLGGLKSAKRP